MNHRIALAAAVVIAAGVHVGCTRGPSAYESLAAWSPASAGHGTAAAPTTLSADGSAAGLPELTERSELSDVLAYAALNNAGLRAAFDRWKAAIERVPQVTALPDPRFSYRYYIVEVETRVGAQRQGFTIAQTFPWFGKLALRGDAAAEAAKAEGQRFQAVKLALFHQVRDAWYEYYYLERAIETVGENRQLMEQIERVLRTRYAASAAGHPDLVRTQVELGKLADRLRAMEDFRRPLAARLNAALNRPTDAPLPPPRTIADRPLTFRDEEVLAGLAEGSPQVLAMAHEIAAADRQVDLARKEYYPDVTVGLDYIDTADSTGGRHPDGDGKDPVIAMVSLNLPIWRDKLSAGQREARLRRQAVAHSRDQLVNDLTSRGRMVLYALRDAERKIGLYRDTLLPKARQSYKVTEAAYRAGKSSFNDLIDTERVLLEFELSFQRALADKHQRLSELEMLVGREIAPAGNRPAPADVKTGSGNPEAAAEQRPGRAADDMEETK